MGGVYLIYIYSLVQTFYNNISYTANYIIIPIVLLYKELYIGLINRKREANIWLGILKGYRIYTLQAK